MSCGLHGASAQGEANVLYKLLYMWERKKYIIQLQLSSILTNVKPHIMWVIRLKKRT